MVTTTDLQQASRALSECDTLNGARQVICQIARGLADSDGASVIVRDRDVCRYVAEDAIEPLWRGRSFPLTQCISGWSMLHRTSVDIGDIRNDPRIMQNAYRDTFVRSLVVVPIRHSNPVGALGVYWASTSSVSRDCIGTLQALADMASVAMQRLDATPLLDPAMPFRSAEERCRNLYDFIRRRLGDDLSDREIARRWGMSWRSYLNLKDGSRRVPRLEELEALARMLGVDPALVFLVARGERADTVNRWLLEGTDAVRSGLLGRLKLPTHAASGDLPSSVDNLPCAMMTLDLRGCIRDFNSRLLEMFSNTSGPRVGDHFIARVEHDSAATFLKLQAQALEHGESGPDLVSLQPGQPVDLSMARIDDGLGRAIGLQCVLQTFSPAILALLQTAQNASPSAPVSASRSATPR